MRLFILGAGASMHAGYPLLRELGPRLLDRIEQRDRVNLPVLSGVHGRELRRLCPSFDDLELVMTNLRDGTTTGPLAKVSSDFRRVTFEGLVLEIYEYFDAICGGTKAELYEKFAADVVRPGDVIITFNYDVSLERELRRVGKWQVSDGYGFKVEISGLDHSLVTVLKLHGSTSWIDIVNGGHSSYFSVPPLVLGARPWISPKGMASLGYPDGMKDPEYRGGGSTSYRSFIPPIHKKFQWPLGVQMADEAREFWNAHWENASNALSEASEVTIIGYSLPATDERARRDILDGTNKAAPVNVCCGPDTERLRRELAGAGLNVASDGPNTFAAWLDTKVGPDRNPR